MSRSSAKSRKAKVTKSLKEQCERSLKSVVVNGGKEIGASCTVTRLSVGSSEA